MHCWQVLYIFHFTEIKDVKKRKERAKELEGIDLSNIVASSRRRSTASFIPPPKPKIPDLSESESEDSENDDEEEEEEVDEEVENDEDQGNGGNESQSEDSDKGIIFHLSLFQPNQPRYSFTNYRI